MLEENENMFEDESLLDALNNFDDAQNASLFDNASFNDSLLNESDAMDLDNTEFEEKGTDFLADVSEEINFKEHGFSSDFTGEEQLENSLNSLSSKLKVSSKTIPVENLILSTFKKVGRQKTIIGLTSSVEQWGIVNPIHVMSFEDKDVYQVLDGSRRLYAAIKNGLTEVPCIVWDFEDKAEGKRLANVLTLIINRSEQFTALEQWEMMQILEEFGTMSLGAMEWGLSLKAGQAMKLKDVMLCEDDYSDIRDKLIENELDIEAAYKKLCTQRKKENRLVRDDNTSVENTIEATSSNTNAEDDTRRLSDDEVRDLLELANTESASSSEDVSAMDMTEEINKDDKYQTTDKRHPVDKEVKQGTFIRDDFKCRCCGKGGQPWLGVLIYHHAVPVYAGGPDSIENGLTLCQDCHMTLHNYLLGKLHVDLDSLSEDDKKIFKNIFTFGNIALKATKNKGISKQKLSEIDKTGSSHAYPDAYIAENTALYNSKPKNQED